MASNGMTKLDAVNMVLSGINEYRVTALDTNGTSVQADAERYIDDSTRYFCAMGWPCNTRRSVAYTPSGGSFEVTVPASVIRIRGAGPSQHRNLVIRGRRSTTPTAEPPISAAMRPSSSTSRRSSTSRTLTRC